MNGMILPNQDPNPSHLADEFNLENYGMKVLNNGIKTAQSEADKYIQKQTKNIFGNDSTDGAEKRPMPVYKPTVQEQPKQSSELVQKAKSISPLIYGAIGFGISKLAGLGTITSAGIGAGTAGAKYLVVDRKQ